MSKSFVSFLVTCKSMFFEEIPWQLILKQFTWKFTISCKISFYHELSEIIHSGPKLLVGSLNIYIYIGE